MDEPPAVKVIFFNLHCARRVVCVLHFVDDEPNPRAERTEDGAFHAGGDHQLSGRRAQLIRDGDTDTRDLRRPLLPQRRTKVLLPHRVGIGLPVGGEREVLLSAQSPRSERFCAGARLG